ncbi:P-type ATPase [Nocardia coffeae]|uniref:P-type ATPase n=1 Tax=Nocardia coffeae TaxID=2873381 RepID=UPI0027DF92F1|nr:hypothetical protein [Nocardia coffeae]
MNDVIGGLLGTASRAVSSGLFLANGTAKLPVRIAEVGVHEVRRRVPAIPLAQLRRELGTLADPQLHRDRRVAEVGRRVLIEVRGLADTHGAQVAEALRGRLRQSDDIRDWRVNAATGHVVIALEQDAAPEDAIAAVAEAERNAGVDELDWDPAATHPADLEPAISAAISLAADLTGVALTTIGAVLPRHHGPLEFLSAAAGVMDTQPRIRTLLESGIGRARTDLILSAVGAVGQISGEDPGSLLADAALRTLLLAEAGARHLGWRRWAAEFAEEQITEPLPDDSRPAEIPGGPVERSADESTTGALAGVITTVAGRGIGDLAGAVALGAPRAARTSRESFAAVASLIMSISGVLTMDPTAWRRFDRLDTLVIDAEILAGDREIVLDALTEDDDWSHDRVWRTGQHLLSTGATEATTDPSRRELRPVDRNTPHGPAWRQLRTDGRDVGQVLVGRELDPRTPGLVDAARRAGLHIVLIGADHDDHARSLADEFVPDQQSAHCAVQRLQQAGHVVAMASTRAHRALADADIGIGLIGADAAGARHVPWSADLLCRDPVQVQRLLTMVAPARRASERGRVLALSAGALAGLLLAIAPGRSTRWPVTAAQFGGLFSGSASAWRIGRDHPDVTAAPLLPWHATDFRDVLELLPDPGPPPNPPAHTGFGRARRALSPVMHFGGTVRQELADPLTPVLGVGAAASAILGSPADALLVGSVVAANATASALQRQRAESSLRRLLQSEIVVGHRVPRSAVDAPAAETAADTVQADHLQVGEVIMLSAGDVVPADGRLVHVEDLEIDESALTGESVTVDKYPAATPGPIWRNGPEWFSRGAPSSTATLWRSWSPPAPTPRPSVRRPPRSRPRSAACRHSFDS